MKVQSPPGATPLDEDTLRGLIPGLTTQGELDEYEAANIAEAMMWASSSRQLRSDLLSASGLCLLHKKMFGDVWDWAGQFRKKDTNIGVSPEKIQNELGRLLGDVKYWMENKTFSLEEIAIRFHHRLVWIHPFPNGNGRFSRFAADLLLEFQNEKPFTWGRSLLSQASEKRKDYIAALKLADREERFDSLLTFAKS